MTHFRMDNTDGYSQSDLDALNAAFEQILAANAESLHDEMDELERKTATDHLAERLLVRYDNGKRGRRDIERERPR